MRRLRHKAVSAVENIATGDNAISLSLRSTLIAALLFAGIAALAASIENSRASPTAVAAVTQP